MQVFQYYTYQFLIFHLLEISSYDRFAGPEGLRGLCNIRSVCEDKISFIRNSIPPPMAYPSTGVGHLFAKGLINMFYSPFSVGKLEGLYNVIKYSVVKAPKPDKKSKAW